MYKAGKLEITAAAECGHSGCDENVCYDTMQRVAIYDSTIDGEGWRKTNVAYLPHSCQEWVIGGVVEIKQLIYDLEEALITLSERDIEP